MDTNSPPTAASEAPPTPDATAKARAEADSRALDAAKRGMQLVNFRLTEIAQAAQAARSNAGMGAPTGAIDALEQQRLAAAADLFHKLGLRALGVPDAQPAPAATNGGVTPSAAADNPLDQLRKRRAANAG